MKNMKKFYALLLSMTVIALGFIFGWDETSLFKTTPAPEPVNFDTLVITAPNGKLVVDIADTEARKKIGLNKYQNLPQGQGMLFTFNYSEAQNEAIGTETKHFPIDIIWLNSDHIVLSVTADLSPTIRKKNDMTLYYSPEPAPYLLALPAGEAKRLGITEGVKLAFKFGLPPAGTLPYESTALIAPKGTITVEIADTDLKQSRGLGDRQSLSKDHGMLFVFSFPTEIDMWMQDMHFPLDIIWLNADKKVTLVESNLSPTTFGKTQAAVYYSEKPDTLYVLELPAGDAERLGITEGSTLSFDLPSSK